MVRLQPDVTLGLVLHGDAFEVLLPVHTDNLSVGQQTDAALGSKVKDLLDTVGVPSETLAPVNERHFRSHSIGKEIGPIKGTVASTADHHLLSPIEFRILDDVLHATVLVFIETIHRRLARFEAAESSGDRDDGGAVHGTAVGGHDELVLLILDDGLCPLSQGEPGLERCGLCHQLVHQVARENLRIGRNVIDRLLGIDLRTLSPRLRQGVDEVAAQLEQPCFEHGEETAGARTDDEDVRLDHGQLRGEGSFHAGCPCNNGKAMVFNARKRPACSPPPPP